jgi:signal peptidase I
MAPYLASKGSPFLKHWLKRNRGFFLFLIGFALLRTAVADYNSIPSGSMRPTLLEGDVVLVNRLAYDFKLPLSDVIVFKLGEPQRGDVVTFTSPVDGVRLIKRLVALPGDVVEMRNETLLINGSAAQYSDPRKAAEPTDNGSTIPATRATERIEGKERVVQFLTAVPARRSFGPVVVPPDSYFVLGDNRDNSADSRYIGFVPRRLLIGRAHHILVSANIKGNWLPRVERVGERIQ